MPAVDEKYRRLPGRSRGLIVGSSLWMGSDHILLVKTAWFREEYKRFYLRDIQAIVVAPGARFRVSLPAILLALAWLFAGLFISDWSQPVAIGWLAITVVVPSVWLAISIIGGCRCRLYTAVSRDELPSLTRTWTARRFLRKVQPLIEQVQGVVDAGWAGAERTSAGPQVASMAPPETRSRAATAPRRSLASDLFALALIVTSAVGLASVSYPDLLWNRVNMGLMLVQLAAAVAVLVQYFRGTLAKAMQRVAVASLVLSGIAFYVQTFTFAFVRGAMMAASYRSALVKPHPLIVAHQVIYGVNLLLGLIAGALTVRAAYDDEPLS